MEVEFRNSDLARIYSDVNFTGGHDVAITKAFRKRIQAIAAAIDERDLLAFNSWRFKRLHGARAHQWSIRLNDQWRLIVEVIPGNPSKTIAIVAIEDYH